MNVVDLAQGVDRSTGQGARLALLIACCLLGSLCIQASAAPPEVNPPEEFQIDLLDGSSYRGAITALDSAHNIVVATADGARSVAWIDVRRCVRRSTQAKTASGRSASQSPKPTQPTPEASRPVVLDLRPSGRLRVFELTLADEQFRWQSASGKPASAPIDSIGRIVFPELAPTPNKASWPVAAVDHDRLLLRVDDAAQTVQVIDSLLGEITPQHVAIEFDGKTSRVARSRVVGVVLAQPQNQPQIPTAAAEVWLTDEQCALLTAIELSDGGNLRGEFLGGGKVTWNWSEIERIEWNSRRLTYLSDLRPAEHVTSSIVTPVRTWQANRSVGGKPMRIAGQEFVRGLGVHAPTRLTYLLEGEYDSFVAQVGLDDETAGRGDCEFVVRGDDRELWRRRCRGGEAVQAVRIPLAGVRRLSLEVEAGEGLDLADHADWGDAHLLRPSR